MFRIREQRHLGRPMIETAAGAHPKGSAIMFGETNETSSRVTVDHFLAGLTVWAVLMVVYALI